MTEIVSGYADILYYDGPILWHGKNDKGQRILGVDMLWHRPSKTGYLIEAIVPDGLFTEWIQKGISTSDLFRKSDVYLCIYGQGTERHRRIQFDELPPGVRAQEEAFCPDDFDPEYVNPAGIT